MSFKTIIVAIISALVAIILFKNTEQSSFWLFGEILTSKLILLGIFYFLGIITGAILFRRKKKQPKEYSVNNSNTALDQNTSNTENLQSNSNLSDSDKEYLSRN